MHKKSFFHFLFFKHILQNRFVIGFLPIFLLLISTDISWSQNDWKLKIEQMILQGEFAEAEQQLSIQEKTPDCQNDVYRYREIMNRIQLEFPYTEIEVKDQLRKKIPKFTEEQFHNWVSSGALEMRPINKVSRYFKLCISNLLRIDPDLAKVWYADSKLAHIANVKTLVQKNPGNGNVFDPITMEFTFRIIVPANTVPKGKTIRCWMPYPQENSPRQKNITLLQTDPEKYILSPINQFQRTIYFERTAEQDKPAEFMVRYRTTAYAQYYKESFLLEKVQPYKTETNFYKQYTEVRPPHIIRTEQIKAIVRETVGVETNPVRKAALLFDWIDHKFPWATSNEYSTMFSIPQYVLDKGHGDCGMKALLYISLLRTAGIPAKWQSGWVASQNGTVGMHDWLEIYFEGIGWVPADMSFGNQPSTEQPVRDFYQSGHDALRLIINEDYDQPLVPPKRFFRSEPLDFQRGEVEWEGGNLYFNQWKRQNSVKLILQ